MKVALVAYEDGDSQNQSGPISSEIFAICWKRMGSPRDFFELKDCSLKIYDMNPYPDKATNSKNQEEFLEFSRTTRANTGETVRVQ